MLRRVVWPQDLPARHAAQSVAGLASHAAASALIGCIRNWENTTHRPSFPPELDPSELERSEEPSGDQTQPGDFHHHDQPITYGERELHSRPVRHHPG